MFGGLIFKFPDKAICSFAVYPEGLANVAELPVPAVPGKVEEYDLASWPHYGYSFDEYVINRIEPVYVVVHGCVRRKHLRIVFIHQPRRKDKIVNTVARRAGYEAGHGEVVPRGNIFPNIQIVSNA